MKIRRLRENGMFAISMIVIQVVFLVLAACGAIRLALALIPVATCIGLVLCYVLWHYVKIIIGVIMAARKKLVMKDVFNDKYMLSTDTDDDAYLRITGMTKAEEETDSKEQPASED